MTKVAIITLSDTLGGTEKIAMRLASRLADGGTQVRAIFPASPTFEAQAAWCKDNGVAAESSPAVKPADAALTWGDVPRLAAYINSLGVEVVNFHYPANFMRSKDAMAARLSGAQRVIATLHSAQDWDDLGDERRRDTVASATHIDTVVAITDRTAALLAEAGIDPTKVCRIYNGIPAQAAVRQADARKQWGIPPTAFVVVCAARLVRDKAVIELVQAFAAATGAPDGASAIGAQSAAPASPDAYLLIAGDGPERLPLEREAKRLLGDRVLFTGHIAGAMGAVYAAGDVFALPSHKEGLPLVYLEAADHGLPSIGTDVGGTREAIDPGKTGMLVPAGDVAAMADAIAWMRDHPVERTAMGRAAQVRVRSDFTEDRMAREYCELFDRDAVQKQAVVQGLLNRMKRS